MSIQASELWTELSTLLNSLKSLQESAPGMVSEEVIDTLAAIVQSLQALILMPEEATADALKKLSGELGDLADEVDSPEAAGAINDIAKEFEDLVDELEAPEEAAASDPMSSAIQTVTQTLSDMGADVETVGGIEDVARSTDGLRSQIEKDLIELATEEEVDDSEDGEASLDLVNEYATVPSTELNLDDGLSTSAVSSDGVSAVSATEEATQSDLDLNATQQVLSAEGAGNAYNDLDGDNTSTVSALG